MSPSLGIEHGHFGKPRVNEAVMAEVIEGVKISPGAARSRQCCGSLIKLHAAKLVEVHIWLGPCPFHFADQDVLPGA